MVGCSPVYGPVALVHRPVSAVVRSELGRDERRPGAGEGKGGEGTVAGVAGNPRPLFFHIRPTTRPIIGQHFVVCKLASTPPSRPTVKSA